MGSAGLIRLSIGMQRGVVPRPRTGNFPPSKAEFERLGVWCLRVSGPLPCCSAVAHIHRKFRLYLQRIDVQLGTFVARPGDRLKPSDVEAAAAVLAFTPTPGCQRERRGETRKSASSPPSCCPVSSRQRALPRAPATRFLPAWTKKPYSR